jgi:hypothetical protein
VAALGIWMILSEATEAIEGSEAKDIMLGLG